MVMDQARAMAANRAARFIMPMQAGAQQVDDEAGLPCVEVAGALVFVYVKDGELVISVDLDTVDANLSRSDPDRTVPIRVHVGDTEVFHA